ncbi:sulfite exporter TauE/SafE family protein [Castellaniella sp. GW247-6E4]|uniref:sulfite exporter TauE/SafE family protein n=1 Tax=Castellaniella sp. GW247-6E4 TaxID=3140380 RepID=UPI003315D9EE
MIPDWLITQFPAWPVFLALAAASFAGCMLLGFSGFGAGLLMAPIFSLLMPPTDVLVLVLAISLIVYFPILPDAMRQVDWRLVLRLLIPSLFGMPVGLAMLHWVDPATMRKTVSLMVVILALLMLVGWHYRGRRGPLQDILAGLLSGTMTAIAGIGGPPVVLYMLSDRGLAHAAMRAANIVFFVLGQSAALVLLGFGGGLTLQQGVWTLMLLPFAIAATLLGALLNRKAGKRQAFLRRVSLFALLGIGVLAFLV